MKLFFALLFFFAQFSEASTWETVYRCEKDSSKLIVEKHVLQKSSKCKVKTVSFNLKGFNAHQCDENSGENCAVNPIAELYTKIKFSRSMDCKQAYKLARKNMPTCRK